MNAYSECLANIQRLIELLSPVSSNFVFDVFTFKIKPSRSQ